MRFALALAAFASTAAPLAALADGGPIQDNSFLIEEAYNQEPGVVQHISTLAPSLRTRAWSASFTEEWPVLGQTHQASVTVSWAGLEAPRREGLGDVALNYRWQAVGSGEARVALAPRVTLLLPTGDAARGLGAGGAGVQVNVPLSVAVSERFVWHVNAGATYVPSSRVDAATNGALTALAAGQSLVWLAHSRLNVLVEALYTTTRLATPDGAQRSDSLTVNPGIRAAIDLPGGLQVVPGVGVPFGVGPSRGDIGLFLYVSFEHPFRLAGPTEERT